MMTIGDHPALIQHYHAIRPFNGRQSVGDDQSAATLAKIIQSLLDIAL